MSHTLKYQGAKTLVSAQILDTTISEMHKRYMRFLFFLIDFNIH
jgi:hypothetical protein